ncbi:hypothetical protein Tco_0051330 [Tanacetum coccineum]
MGDHRKLQLNELRDQAYENSLIYKERTKKLHDSKIRNRIFNVGDEFYSSTLVSVCPDTISVGVKKLVAIAQGWDGAKTESRTELSRHSTHYSGGGTLKHSMDNANIARKRSKPDKHGHGSG